MSEDPNDRFDELLSQMVQDEARSAASVANALATHVANL